jgi:uncharacterized membrane protein YgaE (UPF0421/DUF939 family)
VGSDPEKSLRTRATVGARQALLTATAAWISYDTSSLFGLQEGYWAAISAIVVMQSELQQTEFSGRDRFVGTAIGGLIAWGCASIWDQHPWVYAMAVALSVLICAVARVSNAGRLAGVAVSVIVLIPQHEAIWKVALFRFLEVSWGIAVSLGIAALGARWAFGKAGT